MLFLIPKDDSLLIDNTRPISVTNADNRIITKVLARVLHAMQKGFIPGRVGLDHIREINQRYYSALDRKHQYYILFLDTRKAFDSIHHDFIHATLRKLRVPQWICNAIAGLMAHVAVLPVFSRAHAIPIKRGVKQGCPLSPLLFAICYDVLLTALDKVPDHVSLAFADDLAAGAEGLDTILAILRIINTFAKHSGLGLNIRKTTVLTTREPTATARGLLRLYWPRIKFVTSATYLGVLMGQEITTVDVFRKAMTKFLYRAQQMHMLTRSATLHQRITLYNTYLLPILCYLAQLFIVPYKQTVVPLREHCRKAIIPFNGKAFSYALLVSPTRSMIGPFTPLRDLWATNMAFLAVRYDLAPSHGHELPQMGDMHHVTEPSWGSMLIAEHEAYAGFVFLEDHCPRRATHTLDTTGLTEPAAVSTRRRKLGRQFVDSGYNWHRMHASRGTLPCKLRRFFPGANHAEMVQRIARTQHNLAAATPVQATCWNTFFRFYTNALPTDRRLYRAGLTPADRRPHAAATRACHFCDLPEGERPAPYLRRLPGHQHRASTRCTAAQNPTACRLVARNLHSLLPATCFQSPMPPSGYMGNDSSLGGLV